MPIEAKNKCRLCDDSGADKYVWCDLQHDFICFDCHTKCEHYDGNCFIRGADCKLKHNTDNRQIYVFMANSEEVAAMRIKYKPLTAEQLEAKFNELNASHNASDDAVQRARWRVHLAAIYLEIQDKQNAYVCIQNNN